MNEEDTTNDLLNSLALKTLKNKSIKIKNDLAQQQHQQNSKNASSGLLLFSTNKNLENTNTTTSSTKLSTTESSINECLNNLSNPESILSKLIEFQSNIANNDLI